MTASTSFRSSTARYSVYDLGWSRRAVPCARSRAFASMSQIATTRLLLCCSTCPRRSDPRFPTPIWAVRISRSAGSGELAATALSAPNINCRLAVGSISLPLCPCHAMYKIRFLPVHLQRVGDLHVCVCQPRGKCSLHRCFVSKNGEADVHRPRYELPCDFDDSVEQRRE